MKQSKRFTLNTIDRDKVVRDMAYFFLVPVGFYLTALLFTIQEPNHVLSLQDLIPQNATLIAIVAWALNQVLNTIRKFTNGAV